MKVRASCSSCGAQFAAQPHLYGQRVRCPTCGGVVQVPYPEEAASPPTPLEDPLGGLPAQPSPVSAAPVRPAYRPSAAETGMSSADRRVVWYAVGGAAGILMLLAVAIFVTKLISGGGDGGEPPVAAEAEGDETTPSAEEETTSAAEGEPSAAAASSPGAKSKDSAAKVKSPRAQPEPAAGEARPAGKPSDVPSSETAPQARDTSASPADDEAAIRKCLDDYRRAMAARDGQAAVALVTASTLDYYDRMRQKALMAGEPEVRAMSLSDRMMVLFYRHMLDVDQLQSKQGRELFVYSVEQGWGGSQSAGQASLGTITVNGDSASGQILANGRPAPLQFSFAKEQGAWKLDLLPLLEFADRTLNMAIQLGGQSGDAIVIEALQQTTGRAPSPDIWQPLIKQ